MNDCFSQQRKEVEFSEILHVFFSFSDENHCLSSPCVNGMCNDFDTHYTCTCQPGYQGTDCETGFVLYLRSLLIELP